MFPFASLMTVSPSLSSCPVGWLTTHFSSNVTWLYVSLRQPYDGIPFAQQLPGRLTDDPFQQ